MLVAARSFQDLGLLCTRNRERALVVRFRFRQIRFAVGGRQSVHPPLALWEARCALIYTMRSAFRFEALT